MNSYQKDNLATAVINTTYLCNDNCQFCFNKKLINKAPSLSFKEICKKYKIAKKKWNIRQVILSGGEPTLHPEFFEIMNFFLNQTKTQISLNTNGLKFTEKYFAKCLEEELKRATNPKRIFSLSLSNVNSFPPKKLKERLKIRGIRRAIKIASATKTRIIVVISITKQNYKILPRLTKFLAQEMKKGGSISLRGLYLGKSMSKEQKKKTVPASFKNIHKPIEQAILNSLKNPKLKIRLFNLPLCYFKNDEAIFRLMASLKPCNQAIRVKIRKRKKMLPRTFKERVVNQKKCSGCLFDKYCSRIQKEFLTNYDYPPLIPF